MHKKAPDQKTKKNKKPQQQQQQNIKTPLSKLQRVGDSFNLRRRICKKKDKK